MFKLFISMKTQKQRFSMPMTLLVLILSATLFGQTKIQDLAPKPPLGWNSFDSYRSDLKADQAFPTIDIMAKEYLPFGYEYFVMDAGWYTSFDPAKHKGKGLESFGVCVVNPDRFPKGIKVLTDYAHKKGLKFGVWMMRGISKEAVKLNLPIPGTKYFSADIADTKSTCVWSNMNYGVDMSKPGAQEYYNGIIDALAALGVDFIKVDDVVPNPLEITAIANAIEKGNRKMVFSLSPGDVHHQAHNHFYKRANMVRITRDIWDNPLSIEKGFYAWEKFNNLSGPGFWPDLDMIPFGRLDVINKDARQSTFNQDEMKTFITQRAMAASPLIIGGDLLTMDAYSKSLLTNKEMLACNQNGVMGVNVYRGGNTDVWLTPHNTDPRSGWIGIFNRTKSDRKVRLTKQDLGFIAFEESYNLVPVSSKVILTDVWTGETLTVEDGQTFTLPAEGTAFYKFQM
jgi:alpha-galactosidase